MPLTCYDVVRLKLIYARVNQDLRTNEVSKALRMYFNSGLYQDREFELFDMRKMKKFDGDFNDLFKIAILIEQMRNAHTKPLKAAIIATAPNLLDMLRKFKLAVELNPMVKLDVFETPREALDYLGMPDETLSALRAGAQICTDYFSGK